MAYNWKYSVEGRMAQVKFESGADIAALAELDRKQWLAMACPTTGVRFDLRTLELMDTDHDGRIRTPEVIAAVKFLQAKGVDLDSLFRHDEADDKALEDVLRRQAELDRAEPTEADRKALADWEAKGAEVLVEGLGEKTAEAEASLAAVEKIIDGYFTPAEDLPLVSDEAVKDLPLDARINLRYFDAVNDFREKCVMPLLGADKTTLSYLDWKAVKAKFAPYRGWRGAKPVMAAPAKGALDDEERVLRYRLHLLEFLENFVNMKRLYEEDNGAIYQTGVLRIDGRGLNLCFHVDNEGAHSALVDKSKCCVLYLKISRPADKLERTICAVVTAGTVGGLYVGRNGVFYDRDGKDWEAVVTKVVEAQVSLLEAFWAPWRKIGEGIAGLVKKFLGDKQSKATASVSQGAEKAASGEGGAAGGSAMASSVAAIGIGVGMVGAAAASLIAVVKDIHPWWMYFVVIAAVILVVSLPSVILTWFKLRQRDLGAILNAGGWAVNRPMYFTMKRAKVFTNCAKDPYLKRLVLVAALVVVALVASIWIYSSCKSEPAACPAAPNASVQNDAGAAAPAATDSQKGTVNE